MMDGEERKNPDDVGAGVTTEQLPMAGEVKDSREELISTAVKFLQNEKVKQSALSQKRAFLLKKGLTDPEIDQAFSQAGAFQDEENRLLSLKTVQQQTIGAPVTRHQIITAPSYWTTAGRLSLVVVVVGGAAYGLYALYKKHILPRLLGVPSDDERLDKVEKEMAMFRAAVGDSLQQLQKTVNDLTSALSQHHSKLEDILSQAQANSSDKDWQYVNDLKQEILSLKGILLSRRQFPSAPSITSGLPSWQLAASTNDESDGAVTNGVLTEVDDAPINGHLLAGGDSIAINGQNDAINGQHAATNGQHEVSNGQHDDSDEEKQTKPMKSKTLLNEVSPLVDGATSRLEQTEAL